MKAQPSGRVQEPCRTASRRRSHGVVPSATQSVTPRGHDVRTGPRSTGHRAPASQAFAPVHRDRPQPPSPRVVIIGGGFGGLRAAKALARLPLQITLLDRRNHHLFQPLLYQVATAGLSAAEIAMPIRKILRDQENVTVLLGEALRVDAERKRVVLADAELPYDFLVVAAGARTAYFGHDEWERHAPGLKSIEDALEMRRRIFFAFEAAERASSPTERAAWLTFAIVGAGPTGVELAGAISEIARQTLVHDFRHIDPGSARVILVESGTAVLPAFAPELSARAKAQLENLGVEVWLSRRVTAIAGDGLELALVGPDGDRSEHLQARTVLWAAGVSASRLGETLGAPLERNGQVKVTAELTVPGRSDLFVIGDLASLEIDGQRLPALAPVAIQQGDHVALNIERALNGEPLLPFRYVDKGILATIGRSAAVAQIGRLRLSGFPAWIAWVVIHLITLIGFRNRLVAMLNWIWAYFTYQRAGRLILETPAATQARLSSRTESAGKSQTDVPAAPGRD